MSDKLQWFPFYVDSWETDRRVKAMGPVARSYYLTLLIHQWREGYIPESRKTLRRLLVLPCDPVTTDPNFPPDFGLTQNIPNFDMELVLDQVLECFDSDGKDGLVNGRLAELRIKNLAVYRAKSKGGKANKLKQNERVIQDSSKTQGVDLDLEVLEDIRVKPARKLAHQIPESFSPSEYHQRIARELQVDLTAEFTQFKDHHGARGSTFKDWNLALNTWLRNAKRFNPKPVSGSGPQNVPADYVSVGEQRRRDRDAAKVSQ